MVSEKVEQRYNLRSRSTCNKAERYSTPAVSYNRKQSCCRPSMPYLPSDIIFAILVYLPADILYNMVRYVCREWFNIISSSEFIDAHLGKTERGLLIKQHWRDTLHYVEMEKNDALNMVEVGYPESSPKPHRLISCCNGLVFLCDQNNRCILNYVTKEVITLSPPSNSTRDVLLLYHSMGYTRSKKYKLVVFYINSQLAVVACILTLGVDREWRSLFELTDGTEIGHFNRDEFNFTKPIVSAEGILHVIHRGLPLVLNLDLETETFYVRAIPECSKINRTYLGTGRSLCFMDYVGNFSWELWLLKDAEAGEWTKQAIIELGGYDEMLSRKFFPGGYDLVPVGFLKDGEIVIFNVVHREGNGKSKYPSGNCIRYNVKTGCINSFNLTKDSSYQMNKTWMYNPHVKSLVSLRFGGN